MTTAPKLTPLPWTQRGVLSGRGQRVLITGDGRHKRHVAQTYWEEDAAFIVRAVNNHKSLVAALEKADDLIDILGHMLRLPYNTEPSEAAREVRAALNKALAPA